MFETAPRERKMRSFSFVALLALLAGCSAAAAPTQEQLLAEDKAACTDYGFKPATDGFGNCMLELSKIHALDARDRRAQMAAALASFQKPPSVTCTTYGSASGGFGNSVYGHSSTTCQ